MSSTETNEFDVELHNWINIATRPIEMCFPKNVIVSHVDFWEREERGF